MFFKILWCSEHVLTPFKKNRGDPALSDQIPLLLAPAVGLEPTTNRLTADCSTTELRWNSGHYVTAKRRKNQVFFKAVIFLSWRPVPESNRHQRICSPLHKPFCQPAFKQDGNSFTRFFLNSQEKNVFFKRNVLTHIFLCCITHGIWDSKSFFFCFNLYV